MLFLSTDRVTSPAIEKYAASLKLQIPHNKPFRQPETVV